MAGHSAVQVHKIQAAVLRKKGGPLKIESLELEGPRDDEVLVRIVAPGICHTDIDFCDNWGSVDTPVVLGHEGAGVVEKIGKRVKGVSRWVIMSSSRTSPAATADNVEADTLRAASASMS